MRASRQPFGESYFEVELPEDTRAFVLVGARDRDNLARWPNAVKWLDALPLKLCGDPIVKIATAP